MAARAGGRARVSDLRGLLKGPTELVLARLGPARLARRRAASDTVILAYHDIVPEGSEPTGDRSLHLPRREFARQLDRLVETHRVVSLADWRPGEAAGPPEPSDRRPRAIVTFDDAYLGAVTCGVDELVARRLPATIFVVPARLGRLTFWWDRLADPRLGAPAAHVRERALDTLAGRDEDVASWAREAGLPSIEPPEHARTATEEELAVAAARPGITLGSHTWTHANLAALGPDALDEELGASAEWLERRFASYIPWISYPYGLSSGEARARAAGWYRGGLRIDGGFATASHEPFDTPRVNVPSGASLAGFELRAAGLVGTAP